MNLPDWSKDPRVRALLAEMGLVYADPLPPLRYERTRALTEVRERIDPEDVALCDQLQQFAVDVNLEDLLPPSSGLVEFKGRKVLLYIAHQSSAFGGSGSERSAYRFHLAWCSTLKEMWHNGRSFRYRATQRTDGKAPCVITQGTLPAGREQILTLELCKNCRNELKSLGAWPTPYAQPFPYAEYFARFDALTPRAVREDVDVSIIDTYTAEWSEISKRKRSQARWRCQLCFVDCSAGHDLLHVHHVNGDPSDNRDGNLLVLCIACHANQPGHGHMLEGARVARSRLEALRFSPSPRLDSNRDAG